MIAQLSLPCTDKSGLRAFLRFAATTICHATSRGTGNIGRTEIHVANRASTLHGDKHGSKASPSWVLSRLFRTEEFLLILATYLETNYIYIYRWCYDLSIYYKC